MLEVTAVLFAVCDQVQLRRTPRNWTAIKSMIYRCHSKCENFLRAAPSGLAALVQRK